MNSKEQIKIKPMNCKINYNPSFDKFDLQLEGPLSVCWQITTLCNLSCKYCISNSSNRGEYGLDTETAKKVITHFGERGLIRLDFTGGEPLIRKDLGELLETARAHDIFTIVTTNTLLLDPEKINYLKKYASLVQVSIDGSKEIHNTQRGADVFDKTINNIFALSEAGCKIRLNSFLYNSNKDQIDYLLNLSKTLNVHSHLFILFAAQGRGVNYESEIIESVERESIKSKLKNFSEKNNFYVRLYDYDEHKYSCVLVRPNGDVISQAMHERDCLYLGIY